MHVVKANGYRPGARSKGDGETLNILLLSSSGVGKTTLINSFANYARYKNINDIRSREDVIARIPATFMLAGQQFTVGQEGNQDENESLSTTGGSGTYGCKEHKFKFQDLTVRFIDTPGLADTRGAVQDKKNVAAILAFLGRYEHLHGICILVKAETPRCDDYFKYAIKELLCQLDRSAVANIVWVFTSARDSIYDLGSGSVAVKTMISEIREMKPDLELSFENNYFNFDNEGFRFIVAKDTISFRENIVRSFTESWDLARNEFLNMISYIKILPPYHVISSLCIHRSRVLIETLLPHLLEITENIIKNEEKCRKKEDEIEDYEGTIAGLRDILFIPRKSLITVTFDEPRILCNGCKTDVEVDGVVKSHYSQVCYTHPTPLRETLVRCMEFLGLNGAAANTARAAFGRYAASGAAAMGAPSGVVVAGAAAIGLCIAGGCGYWYLNGKCTSCGCNNRLHFFAYYETREKDEQILNEETMAELNASNDMKNLKEIFLKSLREELSQLQEEKDVIDHANILFVVFLHKRAMVPYNDSFPNYLRTLIEAERNHARPGDDGRKLASLEDQLKDYEKMKEAIDNGAGAEGELLLPVDIEKMVEKLKGLRRYGEKIRVAIEMRTLVNQAMAEHSEQTMEINATVVQAMSTQDYIDSLM